MPGWSSKDERMYEKIKASSRKRGVKNDRAEEIAARTVNKHRREEGHTPSKTTQGTGNPTQGLDRRSKQELYNKARSLHITGRSRMSKQQLVKATRDAQ